MNIVEFDMYCLCFLRHEPRIGRFISLLLAYLHHGPWLRDHKKLNDSIEFDMYCLCFVRHEPRIGRFISVLLAYLL